jgi:hypothetical protein
MENLALYTRLMKYGHFQTDPAEQDTSAHGDPTTLPQYHPALEAADWAKFQPSVRHLLPQNGAAFCATGACILPDSLDPQDFAAAGAFLGGAANKTGKITVDLVQYMNRILKITRDTEISMATADALPAMVKDCWTNTSDPSMADIDPDGDTLNLQDPPYGACAVGDATEALPRYLDSAAVQELVVDFSGFSLYDRLTSWGTRRAALIRPVLPALPLSFYVDRRVPLIGWLNFSNPKLGTGTGIEGFVRSSNDTLRAIEFVHNYAIPDNLGYNFR